jgi:hypothetical protein
MGGRGSSSGGSSSNISDTTALERYSTDSSAVNEYLRTGEVPADYLGTEQDLKDEINGIDNLIDKDTLDEPTTLYRGTDEYGDAQVGDTIDDKAFMSTSTDSETAEGFGDTVVAIDAPAGTNAIDMNSALPGGTGYTGNEEEYILDRGSSYTVTRTETKAGEWGGTKTYVYVKPK